MTKDEVFGIARALLSAVGGFLVGKGYLDSETAMTVAGAVATLVTAFWSVKAKRTPEQVPSK